MASIDVETGPQLQMSKTPDINVNDLIDEVLQFQKSLKKKTCRRCKKQKTIYESGFCEECWHLVSAEREEAKKNFRKEDQGYIRVYNAEGKLDYEHRVIMAQMLGRPLNKNEAVAHRDGITVNNDPTNLILTFKSGLPFEWLVCECGKRGCFTVNIPQSPGEAS